MKLLDGVTAGASMSPDGTYRYSLTRDWKPIDGSGHVLWVMLNPSTASADVDDRTIRRCQTFAMAWGYDGITVVNLFALRATDPHELYIHDAPVGADNDDALAEWLGRPDSGLVVAAWGHHGRLQQRHAAFVALATELRRTVHSLGHTADGSPRHPLYVRGDTAPQVWLEGER